METRSLGKTGIQVSVQCLGAMMFGLWGNRDHDDSVAIIHHALDNGINFVDTADVYSQGESEEIVGKALKGRRDEVVLATKVHGQMGDGVNRQGNSRRWIRYEVEQSLGRLQTDYIDLYQIHRPDPTIDVEETLSVLTDLMREGKVRAIGSSTFPSEQIVEAQWVAERRGYERFRCEQPPYSILARGIERAVLPTCERYGMGVIVWSPLNGGWLTGKYKRGQDYPKGTRASWGLMDGPARSTTSASSTRSNSSKRSRPTRAYRSRISRSRGASNTARSRRRSSGPRPKTNSSIWSARQR